MCLKMDFFICLVLIVFSTEIEGGSNNINLNPQNIQQLMLLELTPLADLISATLRNMNIVTKFFYLIPNGDLRSQILHHVQQLKDIIRRIVPQGEPLTINRIAEHQNEFRQRLELVFVTSNFITSYIHDRVQRAQAQRQQVQHIQVQHAQLAQVQHPPVQHAQVFFAQEQPAHGHFAQGQHSQMLQAQVPHGQGQDFKVPGAYVNQHGQESHKRHGDRGGHGRPIL